jgi:hypothetical protein
MSLACVKGLSSSKFAVPKKMLKKNLSSSPVWAVSSEIVDLLIQR